MDSLKMLRTLVQAVFDKALDEPTFVDMYADLCVRLNERSTSWSFVKVGVSFFFVLGVGCWCVVTGSFVSLHDETRRTTAVYIRQQYTTIVFVKCKFPVVNVLRMMKPEGVQR